MERRGRIVELWSCLPAFQVVAKTQHLPSAARQLSLSKSAVSRGVKRLEDRIGVPLFDRHGGGRLRLNAAGRQLLAAVDETMLRLEVVVDRVPASLERRIRIAGAASWLRVIALPSLRWWRSGTRIELLAEPLTNVVELLISRELDVALTEHHDHHDGVVAELLGSIEYAMCTRSSDDCPESVPIAEWSGLGATLASRRHAVAFRTPDLALVVDGCASGQVCAVLPLAIARAHGLAARAQDVLPPSRLFLARRTGAMSAELEHMCEHVKREAARVLTSIGRDELDCDADGPAKSPIKHP